MPVYHTERGAVEMLEWGDGPELLVMLHAAAAGPQSLSALAALLMRPGLRIVAPALNRYGATVMLDEADRVQAHLDVLRATLELYPAQRRRLFGHSMGGLIGLLGAIGAIRFDAMVLYDPIVVACVEDRDLVAWDRSIVATQDVATFVTAWNETPWQSLPENVRNRLAAMAPMLIADMRAVSHYALNVDRIPRVRLPITLLQGERSPPITHAMTAHLAALLPMAQRVVIGGHGHMGPVQASESVVPYLA